MKKKKAGIELMSPIAVSHSAIDNLQTILNKLAKPRGYSLLNAEQRKFLMGVALAAVVPADLKIKQVEAAHLQSIIKAKLHCPTATSEDIISLACSKPQAPEITEALAKALPDLLGAEDLINFVGQLWEVAIVDQELHSSEEMLVFRIADLAGVPRKRVCEQLARAQGALKQFNPPVNSLPDCKEFRTSW